MFSLLETASATEPAYLGHVVAAAHAVRGRLEQLATDHAAGQLVLDEAAVALLGRCEAFALAVENLEQLHVADGDTFLDGVEAAERRFDDAYGALVDGEGDPGDIPPGDTLGRAAQAVVMARERLSEDRFATWLAEVLVMADVPPAVVRTALDVIASEHA